MWARAHTHTHTYTHSYIHTDRRTHTHTLAHPLFTLTHLLQNKEEGAQERFVEIAEAYSVLSDSEKRKRYDAMGADASKYGVGCFGPFFNSFSSLGIFFSHSPFRLYSL